MRKILLLIGLFTSIITFAVSSFAEDEESKSLDIASVVCDESAGRFMLKYIESNDDYFSEPILPKTCKLNRSRYKVTGKRGPFSLSLCGAQPPVSISLFRNGIPIISDAVLGCNCFLGPSIAEVEITEHKGTINSIRLCIFKSGESLFSEEFKYEPVCRYFHGEIEIKKVLPINQGTLNDYTSEIKR